MICEWSPMYAQRKSRGLAFASTVHQWYRRGHMRRGSRAGDLGSRGMKISHPRWVPPGGQQASRNETKGFSGVTAWLWFSGKIMPDFGEKLWRFSRILTDQLSSFTKRFYSLVSFPETQKSNSMCLVLRLEIQPQPPPTDRPSSFFWLLPTSCITFQLFQIVSWFKMPHVLARSKLCTGCPLSQKGPCLPIPSITTPIPPPRAPSPLQASFPE